MVEVAERQEVIVSPAAAVAENKSVAEVLPTVFWLVVKGPFAKNARDTFACYCGWAAIDFLAFERRSSRAELKLRPSYSPARKPEAQSARHEQGTSPLHQRVGQRGTPGQSL